jgi:hypothetical protein
MKSASGTGGSRGGRNRIGYWLEILVIVTTLCLMLSLKHMLHYMVMQETQYELYRFEARGVVASFRPTPGRTGGRAVRLTICTSDDYGFPPVRDDQDGQVNDVALALGPDILKPGARFEKFAGTNLCYVDGNEYVFFVPFRMRDIAYASLGID